MSEEPILTQANLNDLQPPKTDLTYPNESEQALTGFSEEAVSEMLKHAVLGFNLTDMAYIVRLPPSRVIDWYQKNYHNFKFAVDYNRTLNKRHLLQVVMNDGSKKKLNSTQSRNAQFLLERRYKDEYGKEIKVEVNNVLVDNIMAVVFSSAKKFITDPEKLSQFVHDVSNNLGLIKPTEGMPDGQKLINL